MLIHNSLSETRLKYRPASIDQVDDHHDECDDRSPGGQRDEGGHAEGEGPADDGDETRQEDEQGQRQGERYPQDEQSGGAVTW